MNKIAIFVSGNGETAERVVKLFNEGNRVKTVLVFADDSAVSMIDRLKDEDVNVVHIPDAEWLERAPEVASLIKDEGVRLLALDNFELVLADEILEAVNGEMIRLSSRDQAPREVVAALEADLRKPKVEEVPPEVPEDENPTPESEWADALNIRFTPPKVPTTPPVVPGSEIPKQIDNPDEIVDIRPLNPVNEDLQRDNYSRDFQGHEHHRHEKEEPMPSTWLIWSILVTVLCCFIPGIIAIIFSSQVSSKYYAGDIEGARRSSRMAEIWIIVSFVLGVLSATLYIPFMFLG